MGKIVFYFLKSITWLFSLLPLRVHYAFADFIAFFLRSVIKYRSAVVYVNVARSFPELKYGGIRDIVRNYYTYVADTIVETIWSVTAGKKNLAKIARIENPEVLEDLYKKGKSVIIALGHQGNWEITGSLESYAGEGSIGYKSENMKFAYKKVENKSFDLLTNWIRYRHNKIGALVESKEMARYVIKNRNAQSCYFFIADQSPLPGSRFVVDFLHQQTLMINGPEQLSKMLDVPIVYLNISRESRGNYKMRLHLITEFPKNEEEGYITSKFASLLEEGIKSNPHCWLWSHKRWKRGLEDSKMSIKNSNKNEKVD